MAFRQKCEFAKLLLVNLLKEGTGLANIVMNVMMNVVKSRDDERSHPRKHL